MRTVGPCIFSMLVGLFVFTFAPRAYSADLCVPSDVSNCVVTGAQLSEWFKKPDRQIVDIRSEGEFNQFRIPGSLNLSSLAVKHSKFLQRLPTLIIPEPWQRSGLVTLCKELKERNYKSAFVLQGGIPEWKRVGLSIEGNTVELNSPIEISATQLFEEFNDTNGFVIVAEPPIRELSDYFANSLGQFSFKSANSELPAKRKSSMLSKAADGGKKPAILVVENEREKLTAIEAARQILRNSKLEIFIVKDGQRGIRKFLEDHSKFLEAKRESEKVKSCSH